MNLIKRLFGGLIILAVLLSITFLGHPYLSLGVTIFSIIAVKELINAFKNLGFNTPILLTMALDLLLMVEAYFNDKKYSIISFALLLMLVFIYMIFNKKYVFSDFLPMFFIIAYVSLLMSNMIRLRDPRYIFMLYIIAWGSDTCAYLVGSIFGKHKIRSISHISPNKTVEGFLGGIVGATILNLFYSNMMNISHNTLIIILFTIVSAILSQIGDLIASYIKRQCKVKDFGNLIPGHGGILDRFDSMLFVSPILYLLSIL
ncbi:MAG: phosphatidate cytidylyltransferase [Peptoniphilaceae bacterium]|nr:phosphatidate cytidylyltransferase [Peptoniphilaceae bacterium]MDY6019073.1 phosphatidate cytidylyltransferase [Anaerococcus sp.]